MLHEIQFTSFNQRDTVTGWIYVPACKPKGIVQIIHGFVEHSRRYFHMIVTLMENDFIVAANDHVGHGQTAIQNNTWGDWGDTGVHTMMEDEHTFKLLVQEKYDNLPYFLFGHSMGSFICRDFISKYGNELNGAILCGTCGHFKNVEIVASKLKEAIDQGKGKESNPAFTLDLLGWMVERCNNPKLGNEWICHDEFVQIDHAKDPFDAFTKPTNNQSMYDFCQMMMIIQGKEWAQKVPVSLPIYNIAGDQDPVGNYGQGVYETSNILIETGHCVQTKLYSGYRHEIHNYKEIKNEVVQGIIEFICSCL
ncbi:alpha/beta fold hydrolase [Floccifex sp.]|uniref:alpha/beta fold hydrolase n=1 Tax=Floccifex sp. TaxID=2815810 RepID=UPI003F0A6B61